MKYSYPIKDPDRLDLTIVCKRRDFANYIKKVLKQSYKTPKLKETIDDIASKIKKSYEELSGDYEGRVLDSLLEDEEVFVEGLLITFYNKSKKEKIKKLEKKSPKAKKRYDDIVESFLYNPIFAIKRENKYLNLVDALANQLKFYLDNLDRVTEELTDSIEESFKDLYEIFLDDIERRLTIGDFKYSSLFNMGWRKTLKNMERFKNKCGEKFT